MKRISVGSRELLECVGFGAKGHPADSLRLGGIMGAEACRVQQGGLHNRVTYRIPLLPFSLKECEEYAESLDLNLNREQLAECYMILGGIPGLERARHQQYGEAIQLMNW